MKNGDNIVTITIRAACNEYDCTTIVLKLVLHQELCISLILLCIYIYIYMFIKHIETMNYFDD